MAFTLDLRVKLRRKTYKLAIDAQDARRKREENLVHIRKNKREDNLLKRRRGEGMQHPQQLQCLTTLEYLPAMVVALWSDDPSLRLQATIQFRELLSIDKNLHEINHVIDNVINAGVVHRFVEFLTEYNLPDLQYQAAWALTNIASGTSQHTRVVIHHGALPRLVQLLIWSPSANVREEAVWALGNIVGDSIQFRDLVLGHGVLKPLLAQLNDQTTLSMLRTLTWTLSNICRGNPQVSFDQIKPALPAFRELLHLHDVEILAQACWAISYLAVGTPENIQAVIDAGFCGRLVELLLHPSPWVVDPALRAVGNILTGNEEQTQLMIDNQVLPCLETLLTKNPDKNVKKRACWVISNITAGKKEHIQAVIDGKIIPGLVQLLQTEEFKIREEAAWAVCNVALGGSQRQVKYLVREGCMRPLCDLLDSSNPKLVEVCLQGLKSILEAGEAEKELGNTASVNIYGRSMTNVGGFEKIEMLQTHKNRDISRKAADILEAYWSQDNEADQYMASSDSNDGPIFNFDANEKPIPPGGFSFR